LHNIPDYELKALLLSTKFSHNTTNPRDASHRMERIYKSLLEIPEAKIILQLAVAFDKFTVTAVCNSDSLQLELALDENNCDGKYFSSCNRNICCAFDANSFIDR
jgi:hypothetical protein